MGGGHGSWATDQCVTAHCASRRSRTNLWGSSRRAVAAVSAASGGRGPHTGGFGRPCGVAPISISAQTLGGINRRPIFRWRGGPRPYLAVHTDSAFGPHRGPQRFRPCLPPLPPPSPLPPPPPPSSTTMRLSAAARRPVAAALSRRRRHPTQSALAAQREHCCATHSGGILFGAAKRGVGAWLGGHCMPGSEARRAVPDQ